MNILLVGGHQKTKYLIRTLKSRGHNIVMVNDDYHWCRTMAETYGITCVRGDGTKPYILEDADCGRMDAVAALSNKDAANLVVCQIAGKQFGVDNTIAIVNDPKNLHVFRRLGVAKTISATQMVAEIIEQEAVVKTMKNFLPLDDGQLALFEIQLAADCPVLGKKLFELTLPESSLITCIIRNEQTIIPKGNTKLKREDRLIMLSSSNVTKTVADLFSGRQK